MGVQMVCMIFNHVVKPLKYKNETAHRLELMNDWAILVTYYFMLLFTDLIHDPKHKYSIGWVLISIQATAFIVSILVAIADIGYGIKLQCKKRKYCIKKTKPDIVPPPLEQEQVQVQVQEE